MEVLVTLRLPQTIIREMDVYRKKFHPSKLSHIQSHITLIPPFTLRGDLSDLIADLNNAVQSQRPFLLRIHDIDSFGDDVLFFQPSCPPELTRLHESVKRLVGERYRMKRGGAHQRYWDFRAYHPHVTIASDKPENIRRYKKELDSLEYSREFSIDGIELYTRGKSPVWKRKNRFSFATA